MRNHARVASRRGTTSRVSSTAAIQRVAAMRRQTRDTGLVRKIGFAVAVAVLVAGCGLLSPRDPSPQEDDSSSRVGGPEDRVAVPTSEWETGMAAMQAAAEGILT